MKKLLSLLTIITLASQANAQLISWFTWESNPVTKAVAGANGLSVSSYATVGTGGKNGKGLSPGPGSNDINLVLDGANFNVPALDIQLDFRREESQASFLNRGSYFNFGMSGGNLSANFLLTSGSSYTSINSGNVYTIPDDHSFHTYHFRYDNNSGIAKIWVDGTLVYTYTGVAGVPLYWSGAGNVIIGKDTDATGRNLAVFDNMILQVQANALLPVKMLSFSADTKNNFAQLYFTSTEEFSVAAYSIERSPNGINFQTIGSVAARGNYNSINAYQYTDSNYTGGLAYYRIKMLNADGTYTYSALATVNKTVIANAVVSVYPNPASRYAMVKFNNAKAGQYHYTVSTLGGQVLVAATVQLKEGNNLLNIDLSAINVKGALTIYINNAQQNSGASFTIIKN
ncbi:MAG TPA: hypothetical protein VL307_06130 [Chitinophagaceae bacterium]|nr:hypothetical protein [Chitinophagaceae bacterium]